MRSNHAGSDKVPKTPDRVPDKVPNNELQQLVQRFGNREHLLGVVIYDQQGALVAIDSGTREDAHRESVARDAGHRAGSRRQFVRHDWEACRFTFSRCRFAVRMKWYLGGLAVVHDVSYIRAQILLVWRQTFFRVLAQVFLIVLITLLIVRWSIAGPIARAALWMRALRTGKISFRQEVPDLDMFRPLAREVATMAESLSHARNAAENEARLREAGESMWTADRLSVQLRTRLEGGHLFVVSNREPYMHQRNGKTLERGRSAERLGHRARTRAQRLRWHLDRARQRQCRRRSRGRCTTGCAFLPTIPATACAACG